MIKRFKSKGIIGVPDCDIIFPESKIILIQGPNGSGKSSLLSRITHPLRSLSNKPLVLKDNENDGFLETYVNFNNNDYKITHTSKRKTKGGFETKSYLSKYIDKKWVELVDDGGAQKYQDVIKKEFDFIQEHHDVLNIGVNNFGILKLRNADRLFLMKRIFKLEIVDQITDIVSEKTKVSKVKLDILNKELNNGDDIGSISTEIANKKNQLNMINVELNKLKKTGDINISLEDISTLENVIKTSTTDLELTNSTISILDKYNYTGSYMQMYDEIKNTYTVSKVKYDNMNDEYISILNHIEEAKHLDADKLEEEKKELVIQLNKLENKEDIYNKYKNIDTYSIRNYMDTVLNLVGDDDRTNDVYRGLSDYDLFIQAGKDLSNKINNQKDKLVDINNQLEKITYQENIVSLTPHPMTPLDCPLRIEWQRQINNEANYHKYNNLKTEYMNSIEDLEKDIEEKRDIHSIIKSVFSIVKPENSDVFFKDYKFVLRDNTRDIILSTLVEIDLCKKLHDTRQKLIDRIEAIDSNLSVLLQRSQKEVSSYENKAKELALKIEKEKSIMDEYFIKLNDINNDKYLESVSVYMKDRDSLESLKNSLIKEIEDNKNKLDDMRKQYNLKELTESKRDELQNDVIGIISDIKLLEHKYGEINKKHQSKNKLDYHYVQLKNVRDILKTKLMIRMMEGKLRDVEDITNTLLNGFMSITFYIEDGTLDIMCERDGIIRNSDVLSSGESSILSVALTMALKNYIKWDVISIDEGSAMLDESNKDRFVHVLRDYAQAIQSISQMFIVSHDTIIEDGMDIFKIKIKDGNVITT